MALRLVVLGLALLLTAGAARLASEIVEAANVGVTGANAVFEDADGDENTAIRAGDTVTWTFADAAPHTVTSDTGAFDSGQPQTGGTYQFTFNSAGTYDYYCVVHGAAGGLGMSGTITVQAAPTNTTAPSTNTAQATNTPRATNTTTTRTPTAEPTTTGTATPAATSTPVTIAVQTAPTAHSQVLAAEARPVTAPSVGTGDGGSNGVSGVDVLTIALATAGAITMAWGAVTRAGN
jgi:plastocyanin